MTDYNSYSIDYSKFNLSAEQFDYQSHIHGIGHSYRVMLHCLRLGMLSGNIAEARLAFFGAYIHDMARTHDGYCTIHGSNAANFKLPLYQKFFEQHGASTHDLKIIFQIVTMHSIHQELPNNHELFPFLAILKDADALDRIRLGRDDLNPDFLRLELTHHSIRFGERLYHATNNLTVYSFTDVIKIACTIDNIDF